MMRTLASTSVLHAVISLVVAQEPLNVAWNTQTFFGPDGPWQAIQVGVGESSAGGTVNLYPGGEWQPEILVSTYCNGTTANCPAALAGLYNVEASPTANVTAVQLESNLDEWSGAVAMNLTGLRFPVLDTLTIVNTVGDTISITNSIISAINTSNIERPDGTFYPTALGSLALGAPDFYQVFTEPDPAQNINASELTGFLRKSNAIPSSSWCLQIGSTVQEQAGSLILGGYDQSRLLGSVGVFENNNGPVVPLIDVTLGVETGGTPFNTSDIGSLYVAGGNSSVQMIMNPTIPYMFLPFGMCEAIAQYLPVTFLPGPGLYAWNIQDPQYKRITTSPAYIEFVFEQSLSANISVKLPFALLDLTLESPIVPQSTPYFPCKPFNSPSGQWFLGRAFLQAAYIGMNWEQGKFFFAQAAGPNSGPSQIIALQPTDVKLNSGAASNYENSWSSKWTALPVTSSSSATGSAVSATAAPAASPGPSSSSSGLSTAAKAGIGAGVGAVFLIAIIAAMVLCLRSRAKNRRSVQAAPRDGTDAGTYNANAFNANVFSTDKPQPPPKIGDFYASVQHELPTDRSGGGASELDAQQQFSGR